MTGPVPKRSEERRRADDPGKIPIDKIELDDLIKMDVEIPRADENWEPLTKEFWASFARSGQAIWYEPSDWMTAYTLMETLDRWLKPQQVRVGEIRPGQNEGGEVTYLFEDRIIPMPGGVLSAIIKALGVLMVTEGDRRKLRIELERRKAIDGALSLGPEVTVAQTREEAFRLAAVSRQSS